MRFVFHSGVFIGSLVVPVFAASDIRFRRKLGFNPEVHIALQEGCGQLGVVLLATQSPVSQLEVLTVGVKR